MRGRAAGLAALALAGCAAPPPARVAPEPILASDGIAAGRTGQVVSFGRAPDGALAALTRMTGSAPTPTNCPNEPLAGYAYLTGLTLWFADRMFMGWRAVGPAHATASGLRVGDVGPTPPGIAARTAPDGRITELSAGRVCDIR